MRLAQHLTALRAWCKQCLPGRGKPDVLRPGSCSDERIYGHATTARHDIEYPLPVPQRRLATMGGHRYEDRAVFILYGQGGSPRLVLSGVSISR